jgi:AcrR family transcriptional regulator
MLIAVIAATDASGLESLKVANILKRGRISRKTFYQHFENPGDCLRAAIEDVAATAEQRAAQASEGEDDWTERVRAGLLALLEFFDEEPRLARVCILYSHTGDSATERYRAATLTRLTDVIDAGAQRARQPPSRVTAEGLVTGSLGVIRTRLTSPGRTQLTELLNPLMSFIVLPYRGPAAARWELERPLPPARAVQRPTSNHDLWSKLGLRMTYRTVRVIDAIAARPGLSNAQAAKNAGIADAGQVSKLLARLEGLGVLENRGEGHQRGGKNAWHLTPRGRRLERGIARELVRAGR